MRWMVWLVAGCSPVTPVLQTTTDGGSWTVLLRDAPTDAGSQTLVAEISPAGATLASVTASMPDMGHASDADITVRGDGTFALAVDLAMAGWWVLDGTVTDGARDEDFRLELEVP